MKAVLILSILTLLSGCACGFPPPGGVDPDCVANVWLGKL